MTIPGERLYLEDLPELQIKGETREDVRRRHTGRYIEAIRRADRSNGIWLDFACGSGYGADLIASRSGVYIGIDKSQLAISYAMKMHAGQGRLFLKASQQVGWRLLAAWGIWPDVILSVETLEHLPREEQSAFIYRAANALSEGGVFVLCCPVSDGGRPANPFHLYEPQEAELLDMLSYNFRSISSQVQVYESTAGIEARQIYVTCREPKRRSGEWRR